MIIKLSKSEEQECRKFLEVKENNISAAELYIEYLNEHYDDITSFDIKMLSDKYGEKETYYRAFLNKMHIKKNDEEYKAINETCNIQNIAKLDSKNYLNDGFAKAIGFPMAKCNDWLLTKLLYLPYEGFVYDELKINPQYYQEETPLGYFDQEFPYLAVIEDETIWMSVIPHEINTMKKPIKDAFGRVLVLGLGLGYYAFHVSNKEDVEKVVIIENDPRVILLFKEHILPKFPNKDKIEIIQDDAFHYLSLNKDFDFIFADIWHNVGDGLPLYLKIKSFEKEYKSTTFAYWIETSLLAMLRRQTLTVFEEQYFAGLKEEDYLKASNINDKIINAIYFATKDYKISNSDDLRDLLTDDSLKKLASCLIIK